MRLQSLIRYASYPAVMLPAAAVALSVAGGAWPAWPTLLAVAGVGIAAVALLERRQPYEPGWQEDHGDLRADIAHGVANFGLLAATATTLHALRSAMPVGAVWPLWPAWAQLLLAGAIIDLGLYAMHRSSSSPAATLPLPLRPAWR